MTLGFTPDLLVINRKFEILGCIELKYVPHGFIPYEKDMTNMLKIWDHKQARRTKFYLDTASESGDWNYEKPYVLGSEFHLMYGIIGNEYSDGITNYKDNWTKASTHDLEIQYRQFIGSISKTKAAHFYMAD